MIRPKPTLRVLLIEDEPLLVMDMEAMLEDAGHDVIGNTNSLDGALRLDMGEAPNLAFVDLQLADKSSGLDVAPILLERWPQCIVIFVTANPSIVPSGYAFAHGVIPKPFTENGFLSALQYLQEGVCEPPPISPQPNSFYAFPTFAATWR